MARTITTVTTTAKGSLPYHFICNYCGCRNDKTAETAGVAVGGVVWVAGSLGSMIVYAVKKRRDTNRKLAELAAAPNDPDKLPVIDA